jgi:WD40 repeat protein
MLTLSPQLFIRGVIEMLLSVWDIRRSNPIWSLKEMDDYVSCMVTTEAQKYLVCSSGEGTVTSIDLRNGRLQLQARYQYLRTQRGDETLAMKSVTHQFTEMLWVPYITV